MGNDALTQASNGCNSFGSCCSLLKEAMSGEDFVPLISVGDDDILYMSVGLIDLEDDEPGMVDHPVFYCPFCGTQLQTLEDVRQKALDGEEEATT